MFVFVLVLVSVAGAAADSPLARSVCSNPPRGDDKIRKAFLEGHNQIRQELATGGIDDDMDTLPGSTSLFMLSYNCELEIQALVASSACESESNTPGVIEGKSVNYGIARGHNDAPSDDEAVVDIEKLLEKWKETSYQYNFDKTTVIYESEDAAPFARVANEYCLLYWYSLLFSPVVGKPLYWPSKSATGCTKAGQCKKAIPGKDITCDATLNLCFTSSLDINDIDSTAENSLNAAETKPDGPSGVLSRAMRQTVVDTHEGDRSPLAQGTDRN
ncbi:hypothetical protein NECAME_02740 [Necator americanus]|uniref:SCP domain-containing protein n=1 Tax=Necator americanus TaxID=51031 RepID=W2TCG7_NECAM|nr:hypothetical protein NECAME_02740 [Necator americanus]ETN78876.1 hypothetical protein NECAME_02740 [Necator americanus]